MRTSEYIKNYDLKNGFALKDHEPFLEDFYFDFLSNIDIQIETVSQFTESKFWDTVSTFREKFESIFNKCPMTYPEFIWNKFRDEYVPIVLFDYFPEIREQVEKIKDMDYVTLYRYMFETLSMGDIIDKRTHRYYYIPKPTKHRRFFGSDSDDEWTNSPDESFLESIIKVCNDLLDYSLYYVEQVACERFLSWSENKLHHVKKINQEKWQKEREKRNQYNSFFNDDFFNFFWYEAFKQRIRSQIQNNVKVYFEKLGIEITKDEEKIKKAYKELAMKYHPDKIGNTKENHERMVEINEAKTKCILFCKD